MRLIWKVHELINLVYFVIFRSLTFFKLFKTNKFGKRVPIKNRYLKIMRRFWYWYIISGPVWNACYVPPRVYTFTSHNWTTFPRMMLSHVVKNTYTYSIHQHKLFWTTNGHLFTYRYSTQASESYLTCLPLIFPILTFNIDV